MGHQYTVTMGCFFDKELGKHTIRHDIKLTRIHKNIERIIFTKIFWKKYRTTGNLKK